MTETVLVRRLRGTRSATDRGAAARVRGRHRRVALLPGLRGGAGGPARRLCPAQGCAGAGAPGPRRRVGRRRGAAGLCCSAAGAGLARSVRDEAPLRATGRARQWARPQAGAGRHRSGAPAGLSAHLPRHAAQHGVRPGPLSRAGLSPHRRCRQRARRFCCSSASSEISHDGRRRGRPGAAARRRPDTRLQGLRRPGGRAAAVSARHAGLAFEVRHWPRCRQGAGPCHRRAGPLGLRPQRCAACAVAAGVRGRHGGADGSSRATRASPSAASRAVGPMRLALPRAWHRG